VLHEVQKITAVGLDRVIGEHHVADPRHQGGRRTVGIGGDGGQGFGEKRLPCGCWMNVPCLVLTGSG
jgi:hypothetical protein